MTIALVLIGVLLLAPIASLNATPTNIVATVSDGVLTLTWPADHTGWLLLSNSVGLDAHGAWFTVLGSATTNVFHIPINLTQPQVFCRLTY